MSKQQLFILVAVLIFGYFVTLGGAYFMLKGKMSDQGMLDSLAQADSMAALARERGLDLTQDLSQTAPNKLALNPLSSDSSLAAAKQKQDEKEKQQTASIADSIATAKTEPMKQEVEQAKAKVEQTEQQVDELKNLLALLSSDADSVDEANAKRLSKIIEAMRPDDAAAVMNNLGSKTSARLLISMKQRQAAKILAAMPRERAAEVARYLSRAYEKSAI